MINCPKWKGEVNSTPKITKEMFKKYVKKQASGDCNMLSKEVENDCNLSKEEHMEIIKNYNKYVQKFGINIDSF
ncbi:MAG: hypothetical protein K6E54_00670 [Bacteroidaceae bacterium]|nr:hypothetical protein [Bacteroidaceae bacterium]